MSVVLLALPTFQVLRNNQRNKYIASSLFFIVLVAHNGFLFDFPILLAEVKRRPEVFNLSIFETNRIHFADTLPLLRKVPVVHEIQIIFNSVICHRCKRMGTNDSKGQNWE